MQTLHARMAYLRTAELLTAFALPVVLSFYWYREALPIDWTMRLVPMLLVSCILLQGALYWQLKQQVVGLRHRLPDYFPRLYRSFQYLNVLMIVGAAGFIAVKTGGGTTTADLGWAWGLLGFAVLEQINYYHYQLMYDTGRSFAYLRRNGRLRRAALGLDLARKPISK